MTAGLGQAPGLGEGYEREDGDGLSGVRWGTEWTAGYQLRPSRHDQRWSWQNRGGYVDEMTPAADEVMGGGEVDRAVVVAALEEWIRATHASQMGRTFGVSQPEERRAYAEHLAAGPVAAVLASLGYDIVESVEP